LKINPIINVPAEPKEPPAAQDHITNKMTGIDWLRENLRRAFKMPEPAIDWLVMVYEAIQLFDDVADGDEVERKDLNSVIWNVFVGFNQNSFFVANSGHLTPLLAAAVLKWQASDKVERTGGATEVSFVWRAGYYDLVLMAVAIVHGPAFATQNAHLVMQLYGEKYADYVKEFNHA